MKRIVIVGAGAMGCLFAARLARGGADVTLVDVDAARLALIERDGVVLHDDAGEQVARVAAQTADRVEGPVDLVMLFTKGMHSEAAIRSVAHLADGRCRALTLQNGLGNAEVIAEVFAADQVLLGVTDFPADLEGPNRVASHGHGHVWLGGFTTAAQTHADTVAALLNSGGLEAVVDPLVQAAVWEKAAFNAALNALATITGFAVGGLDTPAGRRTAITVADETMAVAAARGIAMDRARLLAKINFALANHRLHKPSMLQDRLAGRRTEIESINGAILRAGETAGVPTPSLQMLTDLVRMGEPV